MGGRATAQHAREDGSVTTAPVRITHLRQTCHDKDLPFDDVIGVPAGKEHADTRAFKRGEWELLRLPAGPHARRARGRRLPPPRGAGRPAAQGREQDDLRRYAGLMGDRFLEWLEQLATQVGART
jgi:hypothetical protein